MVFYRGVRVRRRARPQRAAILSHAGRRGARWIWRRALRSALAAAVCDQRGTPRVGRNRLGDASEQHAAKRRHHADARQRPGSGRARRADRARRPSLPPRALTDSQRTVLAGTRTPEPSGSTGRVVSWPHPSFLEPTATRPRRNRKRPPDDGRLLALRMATSASRRLRCRASVPRSGG